MKERSVVFAPEARDDLLSLYDWLAEAAGERAAIGYLERLESYCEGFSIASERGQARSDIRPGLRIVGFERRIAVAFAVERERVIILRLFYGERDWEAALS